MPREPQILAGSGVIYPPEGFRHGGVMVWQALQLAERARPRVCVMATATGDSQETIDVMTAAVERFGGDATHLRLFDKPNVPDVRRHLLDQDVIFVSGGSVVNLLALWRAHGLDQIMRECWESGVVLAGTSAGSLCWHLGGPTDSYRDALDVVDDGLGFLPFSNGVHDNLHDQPRRQVYRDAVARGDLPAGYASEDGVALHYVGTHLQEAVCVLPEARAWHVSPADGGKAHEEPIIPRLFVPAAT